MNKKMSLSADSLLKKYGSKRVVDNVSVEVKQGEIVGLLGPNGAGKTTTFYSIVGLIKPDSGLVFIGGENVTKLPMYQRARKGIGYLAQEASVFRNLSVRDNILAVLEGTKMSKQGSFSPFSNSRYMIQQRFAKIFFPFGSMSAYSESMSFISKSLYKK